MDRFEKVEKLKENLQKEKVGLQLVASSQWRQDDGNTRPLSVAVYTCVVSVGCAHGRLLPSAELLCGGKSEYSAPASRREIGNLASPEASGTRKTSHQPLLTSFSPAQELERKFRKQQKTLVVGEEKESDSESDLSDGDDEKVAETDQADFGKVSKRVRTAGGGASGTVRCVHRCMMP
jgi:hypothetical protein